jgi:DNA-binding response OmpR family regulator
MAKILIVEDEPAMLAGLKDNLDFEGYQVDTADRGDVGLKKIMSGTYHLILLDVMLPAVSGFDILREIRKNGITTPIILLTAKGEEMDKVRGLELGADDYITKPFSLRELLARIKVILRRMGQTNADVNNSNKVQIGRLLVDFETFEALEGKEQVKLSHKEFEILNYLCKKNGQIVSREDLLDQVWGVDYQPTSRTVDNFILRLRQKIDTETTNHIITVHGYGYKLVF